MYELKHILVGVNHGDGLGSALEQARLLAHATGASLHPLHYSELAVGNASEYIDAAASRVHADLIVIDGGSKTAGSVVRSTDCPVMTIPPHCRPLHGTQP
jgi:hypothetical protein